MAAEESTAMSYEKIYDMGTGLIIAKVQLDKVREQDINARIMRKEMQDQLTANIKNRGQLESLPLLVEKDGVLEIISGHHRIKSARAAGMKEIIAIIDVSGLSRSKIASKQLAHNAISGFDDPSILREICKMLDDVDDMLESFIGKDIMEEPLEQYDKLLSPAVHFDFKNITFSFLPHQVKDMDALVKNLESSAPEIIGVAPYEQCNIFNKDPLRSRRRLMHKREIARLFGKVKQDGYALIPISVYFKGSLVKVEIALAKGKKLYDKRDDAAKKDAKRQIDRAMKGR